MEQQPNVFPNRKRKAEADAGIKQNAKKHLRQQVSEFLEKHYTFKSCSKKTNATDIHQLFLDQHIDTETDFH